MVICILLSTIFITMICFNGISSSSKLLADESTPVSSPLMPMLFSGGEKSETQKAVTKPAKVQAVLKGIKQSPKKVNLVAELVRGMRVEDALLQLQVTIKRASQTVYQVIHSARANATHNHGLDADRLLVAEAFVGKGFFMKRISYHAKGKCGIKVRPECRLTVVVRETTPEEEAEIAKLKVHNFKKLSKRERRLVPHKLIETTPIWNRKAKSNRGHRVQGCILGRSCSAKSVYKITCAEDRDSICDTFPVIYHKNLSLKRSYYTRYLYSDFFMGGRSFSSQAGAESNGSENDLEDGFCELDSPDAPDVLVASEERDDDQLFSSDAEERAQEELGFLDDEADVTEKLPRRKRVSSELFKAIMNSPSLPVNSVLDKWVAEGKDLDRAEISSAMLNLRNRRMFGRALQLSEWLETHRQLGFTKWDYASRVDLIAKIRGIFKAEAYMNNIPKSFRGELVYRTLLAACVAANNVKKAEEVFNRMKDLNFPVTAFSCNTLLLLYKRTDKKKIADVLLLMENENVKFTLFTFKVLIDTKGQSNDITGMEQVVEAMKAEGIEPDISTQAIIAGHYAFAGLKEKAVEVLKEMEGDNVDRRACKFMLPIYASIGEADEVERLWKVCESDPRVDECKAAIKAWGMLKKVDKAEHVFEKMVKNKRNLPSGHYSGLLKVYADNKMVEKGKDLVQQMADKNIRIGPLTWDGLVKLHVEAGEVEKADSILQKAAEKSKMKPLYNSYIVIMEQYAKRGDVHNAEKIFHRMRQSGYVARIRQFQNLVQAYVNAKTPAYGIKDRMKADNIFPHRALATQLVQVDPFRKSAVSELLD